MCINIHAFGNELSKVIIDIPGKKHTRIRGQLATTLANYHTVDLISHASKVMLKILQDWLQQYVNFQMFKLDLQKTEELETKLPASTES